MRGSLATNGVSVSMASNQRLAVSPLGEIYEDALTIEAFLKNRTKSNEANSLLCSRLMARQEYRQQAISYLAWKRGVTPEEMIEQILTGKAEHLSPEECWDVAED